MPDLLVKLYDLPPLWPELQKMEEIGVTVRKPIGPENYGVIAWIKKYFGPGWAGEAENAFFHDPKTIFIAERNGKMLGFACVDATVRGFFGPTGVDPEERKKGIGRALLLASLHCLKDMGYGYGIIGSAGPVDFYAKCCGATVIPDSDPGVYKNYIHAPKNE